MKKDFSLYEDFFSTFDSQQYVDLQKRFDKDFEKNVLFAGYDFTKEEWFKSTVAAALNHYLISNSVLKENEK